MPEKKTIEKARQDKREGKSASTQAGEFVHEEITKGPEERSAAARKAAKTRAKKSSTKKSAAKKSS